MILWPEAPQREPFPIGNPWFSRPDNYGPQINKIFFFCSSMNTKQINFMHFRCAYRALLEGMSFHLGCGPSVRNHITLTGWRLYNYILSSASQQRGAQNRTTCSGGKPIWCWCTNLLLLPQRFLYSLQMIKGWNYSFLQILRDMKYQYESTDALKN